MATPHLVVDCAAHPAGLFPSDEDRRSYLGILRSSVHQRLMRVLGYCLLRNNVHLLLLPGENGSLESAVGGMREAYADWMRQRGLISGELWQGNTQTDPVGGSSLWACLRDLELEPVRSRVVDRAEDWCWSSARDHLGQRRGNSLLDLSLWREQFTPSQWSCVLRGR